MHACFHFGSFFFSFFRQSNSFLSLSLFPDSSHKHHVHRIVKEELASFNVSHLIHHLQFGEPIPGAPVPPLDSYIFIADKLLHVCRINDFFFMEHSFLLCLYSNHVLFSWLFDDESIIGEILVEDRSNRLSI